jgi:hypothetical protein
MAGILKVDKYQDFNGNDIMTSDGSGNVTIDNVTTINAAALKATPAFHATIDSTQTLSHDTLTKLAFANEIFDTDGTYDTSNYRFTPGVVGKYILGVGFWTYDAAAAMTTNQIHFYKNGSSILQGMIRVSSAAYERNWITAVGPVEVTSTSDYFEAYARPETTDSGSVDVNASSTAQKRNYFYGYKIIGA